MLRILLSGRFWFYQLIRMAVNLPRQKGLTNLPGKKMLAVLGPDLSESGSAYGGHVSLRRTRHSLADTSSYCGQVFRIFVA